MTPQEPSKPDCSDERFYELQASTELRLNFVLTFAICIYQLHVTQSSRYKESTGDNLG